MRWRSFVGVTFGISVAFGLIGSTRPEMPPGFVSSFVWQSDDPLFGGISGLQVSADGRSFIAINDQAVHFSAQFLRDGNDTIIGVSADPARPLIDQYGNGFSNYRGDTEGLAVAADGTAYVSFEQNPRVASFAGFASRSRLLPKPDAFKTLRRNAALEALAIDAKGTLYTLPERPPGQRASFPVFRFQDGVWDQPFDLPRRDHFRAVAADFGPDGLFYLLERRFHGLTGFSSRVRRIVLTASGPQHEETLFQSRIGQHDNLEGLSVWRDAAGDLRLTMISDDNFLFLQRTEIVEYRIAD